jgi:hypothetical protein
MNFIASTAAFAAVPTTAPAMPADLSDQHLVNAANGLIAADEGVERIHREHAASGAKGDADQRADYQALVDARYEHIATLITVPAASAVGIQAKAMVLREPRMIEDWDQHQQIAVSLADDLVGPTDAGLISVGSTSNARDPIFEVIKQHRAARAAFKEAVRIEFGFEKDRVPVGRMNPETLKEYQILEAASSEASQRLNDAGVQLVSLLPTSPAGLVAVCRYMAPLLEKDGAAGLPLDSHFNDFENAFGAFCRTVADTIVEMSQRTEGVSA